jgi:hypothetical protein
VSYLAIVDGRALTTPGPSSRGGESPGLLPFLVRRGRAVVVAKCKQARRARVAALVGGKLGRREVEQRPADGRDVARKMGLPVGFHFSTS